MKFTVVAADAFQKFQLNAGIILTEFDPDDPPATAEEIEAMRSKILFATSDGANFVATPEFQDYGEDVDNVPANTKELKVLDSVTVTMSGTAKTADTDAAKMLMASATATTTANGVTKLVPNADLSLTDFKDLWWVGDYSDKHGTVNGGFMAIRLIDALSTGGFQLQSNNKGKGDFEFEFTGHYSINNMGRIPYEVYIKAGADE